MNTSKTIKINCQGAATQELDGLKVLQGGLKKLSKKNLERLKARIVADGFCAPVFIWDHDGALMILDGTQRRTALLSLRDDGWTVPPLPVVYIYADDEAAARRILLSVSSQYGEWVEEELAAWLSGVDEEIKGTLRLVDKALKEFEPNTNPQQANREVTGKDLDTAVGKMENKYNRKENQIECICPNCGETFYIQP